MVIESTLTCSSSRTFPSSATSRIEEMEVVVRVGFVGAVLEDRAGRALEEVVGGLDPAGRLCLAFRAGRFIFSDTGARGLEAVDVTELAGDTTDGRVAFVPDDGLAVVTFAEAFADGGFGSDGAEGFGGARESRRLGGARAEAMDGLDGEDEELVDFLSAGVGTRVFVAAVFVVVDGFVDDDLTVPAPNVPELMI